MGDGGGNGADQKLRLIHPGIIGLYGGEGHFNRTVKKLYFRILNCGAHTLIDHLDGSGEDQIAARRNGIVNGILHLVVGVDLFDGKGFQLSAKSLLEMEAA